MRLVIGAALGALAASGMVSTTTFAAVKAPSHPPARPTHGPAPVAAPRAAATSGAVEDLAGCQQYSLNSFDTYTASPNPSGIGTDDGSAGDPTTSQDAQNLAPFHLPFILNFDGKPYQDLFVNNNGNVNFVVPGDPLRDSPLSTFTPFAITGDTTAPILAPFFADVDTRQPSGGPSSPPSGVVSYGLTTVDGHQAFCVDWPDVGYYDERTDKLNDFQLLIVDRSDLGSSPSAGDDFDFYFNYDQVQWDVGDASGDSATTPGLCDLPQGTSCFSAVAGWSNGYGTYDQLNGSGVADAFLDTTSPQTSDNSPNASGLSQREIGSTVPGRLAFSVLNGYVAPTLDLIPGSLPPGTSLDVQGTTATFTTTATAAASAYTAMIDWGDGTQPTAGTVTGDPTNGFSVAGEHVYAAYNTYTVTTTVTSADFPSGQQVTTPVTIQPPASLTLTPAPLPGIGQSPFTTLDVSGTTATFTSNLSIPASAYSASIDWGDHSTPEVVTPTGTPGGTFSVAGEHLYSADGTYQVTTTVSSDSLPAQHVSITLILQPALSALGNSFISPASVSSDPTATFTDPDTSTTAGSYSVTIAWGDGNQTTCSTLPVTATATASTDTCWVTPDLTTESHTFDVVGNHAYSPALLNGFGAQTFTVTTTITDQDSGAFRNTIVPSAVTITSPACTTAWTAVGDGNWSTGTNWANAQGLTGTLPGTSDDACIGGDGVRTLTQALTSQAHVQSLNVFPTLMNGSAPAVIIEGSQGFCTGGTPALVIDHALTINPGASLTLGAGCVLQSGSIANFGTITLGAGAVVTGPLTNQPGGSLSLLPGAQVTGLLTNVSGGSITAGTSAQQAERAHGLHASVRNTSLDPNAINVGSLDNTGTLSVLPATTVNVAQEYTQTPAGTTTLGFGSPGAVINVGGLATFAGSFAGGGTPPAAVVPFITYAAHHGSFGQVSGGTNANAAYGPTTMSYVSGRLTPLLELSGPTSAVPYGTSSPLKVNVAVNPATPSAASLPVPDGTVALFDGSNATPFAHGTLQNGVATFTSAFTPGSHAITARYAGTSLWNPAAATGTVVQAAAPVTTGTGTGSSGTGEIFYPPPPPSSGVLATSTGTPPPSGPSTSGGTSPGSGGVTFGTPPSGVSGIATGGLSHTHTQSVAPTLPSIVSVLSPLQISTNIKLIAINLLIALLLVLLLALPAELLNSAVKENYGDITRWLRLSGGSARRHRLHTLAAELPTHFSLIFFMVVGAVLYTLLDPSFGFNLPTAAELLGLLGAFLVITVTHDLARARYLRRRTRQRGRLTTFPAGIVFAVGLVLVSRIFHFQPGFIFGLMTGLAFSEHLSDKEDGRGLALAAMVVLTVSVAAWFIWIPVKQTVDASSDPSFGFVVLDTLLATVWVAGIQSIIFALIPLRFMDGEKVVAWSKFGWLAIYVFSMFVFVHTVLHPTSVRFGNSDETAIGSLLALLIVFSVLASVVWSFFFVRQRRRRRLAGATAHLE